VAAYGPDELRLGQTFANQAAIAIANAQLFEETQMALIETEALYQVSRALIGLENLPNLLQTIADTVAKVLPATWVAMVTLNLEARTRKDIVISGPEINITETNAYDELMAGLTGWVIKNMKPALSPKAAMPDPRESVSVQQHRAESGFGAVIVVPLHYRDKILGTMTAVNRIYEADFTKRDVKLMVAMANQAAIALKNASLFQEVHDSRQLSDSLREIGASLAATLDPNEVLTRILDNLGRVIPYASASVMLLEDNLLKIKAGRGLPADNPVWNMEFSIQEDSLDHKILTNKKPHIIADTRNDPHWIPLEQSEYIRSWLGVPLVVRDEVIGLLNVDHHEPNFYTEEHATIASVFAQQAAIAIENARLFDTIFRHAQQLAVLNQLANEMTGLLEVKELCNTVAERLYQAFDYYNIAIFTANNMTQELILQANVGPYESHGQPGEFRLAFGERIIGRAAQSGQLIVVNDTQKDPNFLAIPDTNTCSEVAIPLKVGKQLIGVICVDSNRRNAFDDSDVAALTTVADQLALALEKARLFAETRQRAEQLEALRQVTQDLMVLRDLDTLLHQIINRAIPLLNGTSGGIYLYRPRQDMLEYKVTVGKYSDLIGVQLAKGEGLAGQIWSTGRPLTVQDYQSWAGKSVKWTPYLRHTTVVGAPIQWGSEFLGVLHVAANNKQRTFTDEDTVLLSQLADQAAIAIQNVRLFEATTRRVTELETIRQASLSLTSSLELQSVLETILNSALKLMLQAENAHIFLYQNERLSFGAAMWIDGPSDQPVAEPRPHGLTYTVAHTGELIVIPDMATHPLYADAPPDWHGTIIGLPLKISQQVVGVMTISSPQRAAWSDHELQALHLLADQAAIAIENVRLFEAERSARKQAETLREEAKQNLTQITRMYELSTEFVSALSTEEVATQVINKVVHATGAHSAVLNLLDRHGTYKMSIGPDEPSPRPGGTTMTIVKTGQPLAVGNVTENPKLLHPFLRHKGIKAFLGLPLKAREQTIGVLFIRYQTPHNFSKREIETMFIFANQAAIAIQNAQLYEQVQQHAAELEARVKERTYRLQALYELTHALSQATQFEDVVYLTLQQLQQTISHQISAMLLITDTEKMLVLQSQHPLANEVKDQIQEELLQTLFELGGPLTNPKNLELRLLHLEPGVQASLDRLGLYETVPILISETPIGLLMVAANNETPIDYEQARLLHIMASQTAETIGRLKAMQAAEHQRLENLVASLSSGIILLDQEHRIVMANRAAEELTISFVSLQIGTKLNQLGEYRVEKIIEETATGSPLVIEPTPETNKTLEVTAQAITTGPEVGHPDC